MYTPVTVACQTRTEAAPVGYIIKQKDPADNSVKKRRMPLLKIYDLFLSTNKSRR
jgi:hypothetical protein